LVIHTPLDGAVTKADATIESLRWDGRAKNYPLEKFFEQLNKAYTDLDENGEPVTEAKKVRRASVTVISISRSN